MTKVSVIVPLYNVEKYMKKSIDSIRNQTYKNIEIILVDDGSPDNCGQIADYYAKLDNRISVIHKENGGLFSARNAGLKISTGDYIMFVDSDDWIEKNMIEEMLRKYHDDSIDLVICNYNKIYENYSQTNYLNFKEEIIDVKKIGLDQYLYTYFFNYRHGDEVCNKLYKAEIIKKNNIYFEPNNEIFSEDKLFNLYYLTNVRKISTLNKSFYNYLQRENSIMHKPKPRIVEQYTKLTIKYISYLENKHLQLQHIYPILTFHLLNSSLSNFSKSNATIKQIKKALMIHQQSPLSIYIKKLLFSKEVYKYCNQIDKSFLKPIFLRGYALLYIIHANFLLSYCIKKLSK